MVKSNPQLALANYQSGVRAAADKYVSRALEVGVPKLQRWYAAFFAAHQAAPYIASPATDADRHRNVQLSWDTTRTVKAQYRGRVAAVAAAVPLVG